nr:hypothetical protein [Campylobacter lari subsp. concheus]
AKYFFDDIDKLILNTSLKAINIIPPFDIRYIDTFEKINHCLEYIDNQISILKLKWMLDISYSLKLSITL